MRIKIDYHSFSMRENVECVHHTERAEWFFKDHNLDYEIVYVDFFLQAKVKCIQWSTGMVVDINIDTVDRINRYCSLYDCKIVFESGKITLQFKGD